MLPRLFRAYHTPRFIRRLSTTRPVLVIPINLPFETAEDEANRDKGSKQQPKKERGRWYDAVTKAAETAGVMVTSLSMLGLAGIIYHKGYQQHALSKMEAAFSEGDPAFELTMHSRKSDDDDHGW
jgi:hypothetical protein